MSKRRSNNSNSRQQSNPNRRTRRNNDRDLDELVRNNALAMVEGPRQKRWTQQSIKNVVPLNDHQHDMVRAYYEGNHVIAAGSPGTGKTFLALYLAINDVLDKSLPQDQLKIVRSVVPSREMGHLPGDKSEKCQEYESPYIDIMADLCGKGSTYADMKEVGIISFDPTSFVRGTTWDNTIVVLDEVQNMTWHEIHSVITRLGANSRLIVAGDGKQCDLNSKRELTGFGTLMDVTSRISNMVTVQFTSDDCVRGPFVKEWLKICEDLGYI